MMSANVQVSSSSRVSAKFMSPCGPALAGPLLDSSRGRIIIIGRYNHPECGVKGSWGLPNGEARSVNKFPRDMSEMVVSTPAL